VTNLETKDVVRNIFDELSPDAKLVLAEVIKIEHANLHLGHPHGLPGEIQSAIERVIR
jgi:hypothetical protein